MNGIAKNYGREPRKNVLLSLTWARLIELWLVGVLFFFGVLRLLGSRTAQEILGKLGFR
ncbi:MAG TPA: hypothetical protein VEH49_02475 [Methylomirabilota bacterium]|nr:hypothetical protein [Methylomirabilota bacterium]